MRATVSPDRLDLTEVRRFRNGPVPVGDRLYWDILGLWTDILAGLRDAGDDIAGIGIDTWAVDYGLIGADGLLLGNPRNYRDHRTTGIAERLDDRLSTRGPVPAERAAAPAVQHDLPVHRRPAGTAARPRTIGPC